jgi:hypothetical protein
MTLQDLRRILDGIENVGHCYGYFPENQEVPYIAYYATEANPIYSDGQIIYSEDSVTMNLVTRYRDLAAESYIDRMLRECGVQYAKTYEIDSEQKMHTVTYQFTV